MNNFEKRKSGLEEIYILDIYSTFLLYRVNRRNISPVALERLRLSSHQDQINTRDTLDRLISSS